MLGGADNPNGELLSYIIGADNDDRRHWNIRDLIREELGKDEQSDQD
nr:hypothetical protein [Escherichia coli]